MQIFYPVLKKNNPDTPVLIREVRDTPARMFARYGVSYILVQVDFIFSLFWCSERGVEKHVELDNLSSAEVERKVSDLLAV